MDTQLWIFFCPLVLRKLTEVQSNYMKNIHEEQFPSLVKDSQLNSDPDINCVTLTHEYKFSAPACETVDHSSVRQPESRFLPDCPVFCFFFFFPSQPTFPQTPISFFIPAEETFPHRLMLPPYFTAGWRFQVMWSVRFYLRVIEERKLKTNANLMSLWKTKILIKDIYGCQYMVALWQNVKSIRAL